MKTRLILLPSLSSLTLLLLLFPASHLRGEPEDGTGLKGPILLFGLPALEPLTLYPFPY